MLIREIAFSVHKRTHKVVKVKTLSICIYDWKRYNEKKQYRPYINIFHSNIGKYKELSPKVLHLKTPTGGPFLVDFFSFCMPLNSFTFSY